MKLEKFKKNIHKFGQLIFEIAATIAFAFIAFGIFTMACMAFTKLFSGVTTLFGINY